jgi:predicted DNA-binding helix-hairpin-helix protein
MTKLFRDVNYYIVQASNSTQREFELDFADVIEVYDTNSITLTTEDKREVVISWCEKGYFKSYFIQEGTMLMRSHPGMVEEVISMLRHMEIDGETMQYIIEKVGMSNQIMRQLMLTEDFEEVEYVWEELKSR